MDGPKLATTESCFYIPAKEWRTKKGIARKPWSYFILAESFIKIGSAIRPEKRLKELQTGCPHRLLLLAVSDLPERWLHDEFRSFKVRDRSEWFSDTHGIIKRWIKAQWSSRYGDSCPLSDYDVRCSGMSRQHIKKLVSPYSSVITQGAYRLAIDERSNVPSGSRLFMPI